MKKFHSNSVKALAFSASALAFVVAGPAYAQDEGQEQSEDEEEQVDVTSDEPESQDQGRITVTGSRIVRDTYSSISPLQVLTTEASQEAGLFDPSQILQRSESASGQQIDATFQGFVLDNGPGSVTLNLRGLGADRTLLMINGRRLAPAGVEGAPTVPSLNLLPGSLIDRYDLLLDGASSVYGSDAVAGVGNVILRKDFDGLELFGRGEINPQGSGEDYSISAAWGFNTDRAFFGIGAEYDHRDALRLSDRDFFQGCNTQLELTSTGEIRRLGINNQANALADSGGTITTSTSECAQNGFNGRISIPFTSVGSVYFTEGASNSGIPNFNESFFAGSPVDGNGDGIQDVDFLNEQNLNGINPEQIFLSEQNLFNVMAYGEYTFPGEANITPYFEALYSRAEISADNEFFAQIFPFVPDDNQFNPCNTAVTGVDCRADTEASLPGSGRSALGPISVRPIFAIQGDRNNTDVVQEQYRGVLGVRGDLPFIGSSWTFDVAGVYSRAEGTSNVRGIREDKLAFALGIDPTQDFDGDGIFDNNGDGIADDYISGQTFGTGLISQIVGDPASITPCDATALANPDAALSDLTQGCVPVNLFAPSVLGVGLGDFETAAERDYVFGDRSFDTTYEQVTLNAFATGDLFELPAGPVGAVVGVEYRFDRIASNANSVASNGLFFGFFADSGAVGSKRIFEAFGEIDVPLMAGKPLVEELNVNLSGRVTNEQFYGTNFTYAIKGGWRPISELLVKLSYGTSFRAPNLRENFLGSQTGFNTLFDPCAVPDDAFNDVTGTYDATQDDREDFILANCVREGRDPTSAGLQDDPAGGGSLPPIQNPSVEIARGGSLDINPETSRSITAGMAYEDTWGSDFDVSLGINYFDIKLEDSIISPNGQFILNDCYGRDDGTVSPFCDRISVSTTGTQLVSDIFAGFINLNEENVRGLDFNATMGKEVMIGGTSVDFGLNVRANHLIERSTLFINDDGSPTFDDDAGEFSLPKWTGTATFTADIDDLRFTWQTRYTGAVEQDADGIDDFSDAFGFGPDGTATGFVGNTCLGGGSRDANGVPDGIVAGDGVFCRDVGFADEIFYHTASLRYRADNFTVILGVDNIFDTSPPQVDGGEVLAIANTAIGNGYDYDGREFFGSIRFEF
ncbi:TonB-dependent receptor domain-containing protein [Erythrobacter crassostreae]|uniref:TonB-dependent receptor n=1 Tax=Erythrobacter crassostreae TaxID=2828328 RepID=A0A9X1JMZ7_9SPHN|nr:TonB-dependent receptor [Erythrobacter crassostrea]MBV7259238.1 TonB-dependent receptor [Erythrobacter crassostrea]